MKVTTKKPDAWSGSINIEFTEKKEAEIFFSVFNTSAIADAIKSAGADYRFSSNIYDKASELGVNPSANVNAIHEFLKKRFKSDG
jgi:hypothetical protein